MMFRPLSAIQGVFCVFQDAINAVHNIHLFLCVDKLIHLESHVSSSFNIQKFLLRSHMFTVATKVIPSL